MGRIIAVCSGCGGTGKSTVALSVAIAAAKRGMQTILLDASGSARACDLMLGLESVVVLDLMDVVKKQTSLQAAVYDVPGQSNLSFACASLYEGISLRELSGTILALRTMCSLLVIDLPAGAQSMGQEMLSDEDAVFMITRPDDISIRALERTMSMMSPLPAQRYLIVNRADSSRIKKKLQYSVKSVEMLLDMPVSCVLYEEESLYMGVGKRIIDRKYRLYTELGKLLEQVL